VVGITVVGGLGSSLVLVYQYGCSFARYTGHVCLRCADSLLYPFCSLLSHRQRQPSELYPFATVKIVQNKVTVFEARRDLFFTYANSNSKRLRCACFDGLVYFN
jgi:hypothetical protein